MVQCFAPECRHQSESHTCRFFGFPSKENKPEAYNRWIKLLRRKDREPGNHSRVCSCHFRDGDKSAGPEIYPRNAEKLFPTSGERKKERKQESVESVEEIVRRYRENEEAKEEIDVVDEEIEPSRTEVVLQAELYQARSELKRKSEEMDYMKNHYTVSMLSEEVVRMETGLPTKDVFNIVVRRAARFRDDINYYAEWKVTNITFEDQIFITLMKLRQNYTNLHIAQLFSCSRATISNITTTFIHVLHDLLFKQTMLSVPSRQKNELCAPSSFSLFTNCRIIVDCTDIEIATPSTMSHQSATYSSYRGMNSFKVLVGVAPNAVITFVSGLYPGSVSDKEIVAQSGLLNAMETGDLILADKGFLIQDMVPNGVSVNIPPFLENGKFTESEIIATRNIARCRIHVERANARLKSFKILSFVPAYLRSHVGKVFQLCAALVNLQYPLIKECCEDKD